MCHVSSNSQESVVGSKIPLLIFDSPNTSLCFAPDTSFWFVGLLTHQHFFHNSFKENWVFLILECEGDCNEWEIVSKQRRLGTSCRRKGNGCPELPPMCLPFLHVLVIQTILQRCTHTLIFPSLAFKEKRWYYKIKKKNNSDMGLGMFYKNS